MVDHEFLRHRRVSTAGQKQETEEGICRAYGIRCGSVGLLAVANMKQDKGHSNCAGLKKHTDGKAVSV